MPHFAVSKPKEILSLSTGDQLFLGRSPFTTHIRYPFHFANHHACYLAFCKVKCLLLIFYDLSTHGGQNPKILDVGCGEGYYTQGLAQLPGVEIAGVDLSKAGLKKAARRVNEGEFAVASVYHLPVADEAVDVVVDCFAPLALEEYRRVLRQGGLFVYVVPAPQHLMEMKAVLYDTPYPNPEEQVEYEGFSYVDILPVTTTFTLPDQASIQALFGMTPYAWKTPRAGVERLEQLEQLTVTADFRVHVFRREGCKKPSSVL